MRELKFRAWLECKDKELNHMIYDRISMCNIIRDHIRGYRMVDNEGFYAFHKENSATYYIMQYTGIKDKNGKEIYEGDFIQYDIQGITQATYYEVKDIQDIRLQMNRDDPYYCRDENIIVVGNVYENPGLPN